jgi:hypothetical protein
MVEFGEYTFAYIPPKGSDEPAWEMTISAEATLPQLIDFYEKFLLVAGYVLDGRLVIEDDSVVKEMEDLAEEKEFWEEQTFKLLRSEE